MQRTHSLARRHLDTSCGATGADTAAECMATAIGAPSRSSASRLPSAELQQEQRDEVPGPLLFVRRSPEEYSHLRSVESSLTVLLRREASREHADRKGGISQADLSVQDFDGSKIAEIQVHLPPYNDKDAVATMAVPMAMRISDLCQEVIRQNTGRISIPPFVNYELRLYDEDEQEPDYECPSFDENLRVGCLNVCDLALCPALSPGNTPPSPPLSCPAREADDLSSAALTPEDCGILSQKAMGRQARSACSFSISLTPEDMQGPAKCGATAAPGALMAAGALAWVGAPVPSALGPMPAPPPMAAQHSAAAPCSVQLGLPGRKVHEPSCTACAAQKPTMLPPDSLVQDRCSGCPAADPTRPPRWLEGLARSPRRQQDSFRRPSPCSFFFNEHTASIATEYFVTVAARGSRIRPTECTLVVDRERLSHQAPRRASPWEKHDHRKANCELPFLKRLKRHLQLADDPLNVPKILADRWVRDIRSVSCDYRHHRAFSIVYSEAEGGVDYDGSVKLDYQAQTPTECAEIVARVNFLISLAGQVSEAGSMTTS